ERKTLFTFTSASLQHTCARTRSERRFGDEPGLADARFTRDKDAAADAPACRIRRAAQLLELLCATEQRRCMTIRDARRVSARGMRNDRHIARVTCFVACGAGGGAPPGCPPHPLRFRRGERR